MTIEKKVHSFKTKHKQGFTRNEIATLLNDYPEINLSKFNEALTGITGLIVKGELITYPSDVVLALHCGLENRNPYTYEWD